MLVGPSETPYTLGNLRDVPLGGARRGVGATSLGLSTTRDRVLVDLLRWAPKGTLSRLVGAAAKSPIPLPLRRPLYEAFARASGADLSEVAEPLETYPSLDAFFTRRLRDGVRPQPPDADALVSPCDGTISEHGAIRGGTLVQAKGLDYELDALLADPASARTFTGGTWITIYLAPKNYHRVHFATAGRVTSFHHIPGAFFPVNPFAARNVPGLFGKNERLVTYHEGPAGRVATIMVAASGVGHITVTYDAVETHRAGRGRPGAQVPLPSPIDVARGDELGAFHLGSTVVLLFEPGRVVLGALDVGQPVRLGEPIGRVVSRAGGRA